MAPLCADQKLFVRIWLQFFARVMHLWDTLPLIN